MMRLQWRNGGFLAPFTLAATVLMALGGASAHAWQVGSGSAGGWLAGEVVSETVVGDRAFEATGPGEGPLPQHAAPAGPLPVDDPALGGESAVPGDLPILPDGMDGGHGAACGCPECAACEQPGFMQVLHDHLHGCWTLRADALLLWRNAPRLRPIYSQYLPGVTPNGYGATALDANQLESTPAAGPRFSLFRSNNCGEAIDWPASWFVGWARPSSHSAM